VIELRINGTPHRIDVDPDMPLLWALRDHLGLTGTKYGCGIGECGACSVHADGSPVRSCQLPVSQATDADIRTIEGLAKGDALHRVQKAWLEHDVPQCGYCQSGMIMAVAAFLDFNRTPSDLELDQAITNICRCGTYVQIRQAVRAIIEAEGKTP